MTQDNLKKPERWIKGQGHYRLASVADIGLGTHVQDGATKICAKKAADDFNRSSRRCYAFFHPSMPDEPLIFVQVALVQGLADNVQVLLDVNAHGNGAEQADCAIFYSISNCQRGLASIGFGDFLIKRVASDISRDLPTSRPSPHCRRSRASATGWRRWTRSRWPACWATPTGAG